MSKALDTQLTALPRAENIAPKSSNVVQKSDNGAQEGGFAQVLDAQEGDRASRVDARRAAAGGEDSGKALPARQAVAEGAEPEVPAADTPGTAPGDDTPAESAGEALRGVRAVGAPSGETGSPVGVAAALPSGPGADGAYRAPPSAPVPGSGQGPVTVENPAPGRTLATATVAADGRPPAAARISASGEALEPTPPGNPGPDARTAAEAGSARSATLPVDARFAAAANPRREDGAARPAATPRPASALPGALQANATNGAGTPGAALATSAGATSPPSSVADSSALLPTVADDGVTVRAERGPAAGLQSEIPASTGGERARNPAAPVVGAANAANTAPAASASTAPGIPAAVDDAAPGVAAGAERLAPGAGEAARVAASPEAPPNPAQVASGTQAVSAAPAAAAATAITGSVSGTGLAATTEGAVDMALRTAPGQAEFGDEVAASMRVLVRDGVREARLQLHPAELGRLLVTISTDGDQAKVAFVTDTAAAREAIEQALPRLREALQQSGLQLAQSDVGQRDAGAGSGAHTASVPVPGEGTHAAGDDQPLPHGAPPVVAADRIDLYA
jgi:flagellar hook-length control protein FliK